MAKPNNSKTKWIWVSVLVLLVCVVATATAFFHRLDSFLLDDKGAISLITDNTSKTDDNIDKTENTQGSNVDNRPTSQVVQSTKNPDFEAGNDDNVWNTTTQVELLRVSYVNGEQVVTVKSENGDKVIAPGTENSYTFKLKNTGNVALDYTATLETKFSATNIEIPVTVRMNRYDGTWVIGGKDEYIKVSELDTAEDKATLGSGKYTYYTFDWCWPFESGTDELDTMLGNLTAEQDLIFTIAIKTVATESSNPYDESGITPPQTGDNTNITFWIIIAVSTFAIIMFFIFYRNIEKQSYATTEAEKI